MDVDVDVNDDLENIELDFHDDELMQNDFISCADLDIENLDKIQCLGAPFFLDGQKRKCACNEFIERRLHNKTTEHYNANTPENGERMNHANRSSKIFDEKGIEPTTKKRSIHIEQFLLDLLNSGGYEAYIHWTVKERREFKISRPQRIAAMWGDRKSRKLLSDEKLTRALRYSAKKGKLEIADSKLMLYRFL